MNINNYDLGKILSEISSEVKKLQNLGEVADYIPALASVDPTKFSLTLIDKNKQIYSTGEDSDLISLQSVSKVFTLTMVLGLVDEDIWSRMGREPSGKSFNSLIHLEENKGIPNNPFINPGAIVLTDILFKKFGKDTVPKYLKLMQKITGNKNLKVDRDIYESEVATGHKNYSFAHYIKSFGNIENSVEEVLEAYFSFCSVTLSNVDIARAFYFLMNEGISFFGDRVASPRHCKQINSLMFTCGTYDEVGEFAYTVGLPVKSGVSGVISGCLPGQFSVSVWSPCLNKKGNSYLGFKALETLTTRLDQSYFS